MTDPNPLSEPSEHRLKRMRMRSWRRGTKEMDMILGPFADKGLAALNEAQLLLYDDLLEENDQDLYRWVSGQENGPNRFADLIAIIARAAGAKQG